MDCTGQRLLLLDRIRFAVLDVHMVDLDVAGQLAALLSRLPRHALGLFVFNRVRLSRRRRTGLGWEVLIDILLVHFDDG